MNGIVNVLKPPGMTSHDVVAFLRRVLKVKKVGHTGTLDPGVTGVLPICIGRATKIVQYLTNDDKVYQGRLKLGISTDTQDSFGQVIAERDASALTKEEVLDVVQSFVGEIAQVPPMVSAVKHQGKRLYELAREGKEVERTPRPVKIYSIQINDSGDWQKAHPWVEFIVRCSKGTYIRTLCADIGDKLGVGGHMASLERLASGAFTIEKAVTLGEIEAAVQSGNFDQCLQPIAAGIPQIPKVIVKPGVENSVAHGNRVYWPGIASSEQELQVDDIVQLHNQDGLLAIAKVISLEAEPPNHSLALQPITVF